MRPLLNAIKATYLFFAGDAILLVAVLLAFGFATLLDQVIKAPNVLVAIIFVALIVGGLGLTLGRELGGRKRHSSS